MTNHAPPVRRCDECGQVELISIRGRDGRPELCHKCARNNPAVCALCGERRRCYRECRRNRVRLVERIPHAFIYIRSFRSDFLF